MFSCCAAFAQQNFHRFSIGAYAGKARNVGDLNQNRFENFFSGSAEYYFTPYITLVGELGQGVLAGTETASSRTYSNRFRNVLAGGKFFVGQLMGNSRGYQDRNGFQTIIKGIYVGTGAGIIENRMQSIYRNGSGSTGGQNYTRDLYVPVMAGVEISPSDQKRFAVTLNTRMNYVFGDNVDGYYTLGSSNDRFNSFTVGLKYKLGPQGIF
jgi:hypothetical protein